MWILFFAETNRDPSLPQLEDGSADKHHEQDEDQAQRDDSDEVFLSLSNPAHRRGCGGGGGDAPKNRKFYYLSRERINDENEDLEKLLQKLFVPDLASAVHKESGELLESARDLTESALERGVNVLESCPIKPYSFCNDATILASFFQVFQHILLFLKMLAKILLYYEYGVYSAVILSAMCAPIPRSPSAMKISEMGGHFFPSI